MKTKLSPFFFKKLLSTKCDVLVSFCAKPTSGLKYYFPFCNTGVISSDVGKVLELSAKSNVSSMSLDLRVNTTILETKEIINHQKLTRSKFLGSGKVLASLDTGVNHLDFFLGGNSLIHFEDVIKGRTSPYDDNGHGTMTAGVAVGKGIKSGLKFSGIAPKAKLVSIKCLDELGTSSTFSILKGMQALYDLAKKTKIDVALLCFGSEYQGLSDPLVLGAKKLMEIGILPVCAIGNSGEGTVKSPGCGNGILSTGAAAKNKKTLEIASFSSGGVTPFGKKPELYLPGVDIVCPSLEGYRGASGTSISGGILAGIALVLKERTKLENPYKLAQILSKKANGGLLTF